MMPTSVNDGLLLLKQEDCMSEHFSVIDQLDGGQNLPVILVTAKYYFLANSTVAQ